MRKLPALALAGMLVGCAQTPVREWYVVLPSADGHAGSVVVTRDGVETTLSGDYSALRSDGAAVEKADRRELDERFGAVLAAIPPRPMSFTLFFENDSDELTTDSRARLASITADITRYPAPRITVIGHADAVGTHEHNDALSLRRAQRIRAAIAELGIASERITAEGRGKRELLVPKQETEPRNRRVDVEVR